MIGNRT